MFFMFGWTKKSDWLTVPNAKAQVEFFKKDLEYAENYYKYVKSFSNNKWKGYNKMLKIAIKDVYDSKIRLANAEAKLEEAIDLETKF